MQDDENNIPFWKSGLYVSSVGVEKERFEEAEKKREQQMKAFREWQQNRQEQIDERPEPVFDLEQAKSHPPLN